MVPPMVRSSVLYDPDASVPSAKLRSKVELSLLYVDDLFGLKVPVLQEPVAQAGSSDETTMRSAELGLT